MHTRAFLSSTCKKETKKKKKEEFAFRERNMVGFYAVYFDTFAWDIIFFLTAVPYVGTRHARIITHTHTNTHK